MSGDYTVRLERVFSGPLDLLLHLVREQEVEIHEIEINTIIDGYLRYLSGTDELDLELAGDFLVMAASLMAIKARSLLPREEVDLAAELDPRDELVQRLIEYRRFRNAADGLERRMHERARLSERGWKGEVQAFEGEVQLDLGELTAFDLLAHYSRLLRETNANRPHRVAGEARPLRYYVQQLVQRVRATQAATLRQLLDGFADVPRREAIVGSFCAMLELVRLGVLHVRQDARGGEIEVELQRDFEGDLDELVRNVELEDEPPPADPAAAAATLDATLDPAPPQA